MSSVTSPDFFLIFFFLLCVLVPHRNRAVLRTWARAFKKLDALRAPLVGSSSGARVLSSPASTGWRGIGGTTFQSFLPPSPSQENLVDWGWSSSPTTYPLSPRDARWESGNLVLPEDTGGWGLLASLPRTIKVKGHNGKDEGGWLLEICLESVAKKLWWGNTSIIYFVPFATY